MTKKTFATTYHRDGRVTYWSVYNQQWVRRAEYVPDEELAAMNDTEREKVRKHIAGGWHDQETY